MFTCPNGHSSHEADFCDTCGVPIQAAPVTETPAAEAGPGPLGCPNCQTPNVPQALFCEACGYDFMTGTVPDNPWMPPNEGTAPAPAPEIQPLPNQLADQPSPDQAGDPALNRGEQFQAVAPTVFSDQAGEAEPEYPQPSPEIFSAELAPAQADLAPEWVAEVWIDPDWYELQGSPDPLPSAGLPTIVPLTKRSNLIGRVSASKQTYPEVDCDLDTGCSRRHAILSTDGARWWVEDLDSANGTFVGPANGPLPSMPIPRGKVELGANQRIYLGSWTRIVVRKATADELEAFAG